MARIREGLARSSHDDNAEQALAIGKFRLAGEVHQWMYDRVSLARLLKASGFCDPVVRGAAESGIAGWDQFHLDATPQGVVIKPDSFFMEARKSQQ